MAKKQGWKKAKHSEKHRASKKSSLGAERVPTGIPGLDKLIEGGFIPGSSNLICGGTGAGKTIFCIQFLLDGLRKGENCLFLTLEEQPHDVISDVARFEWDLKKHKDSGKLILEYRDPFQAADFSAALIDKINEHKVSRVVVDSVSILGLYFKDPFEVRKELFKLVNSLKSAGVTALLTSEIPEDSKGLSRFGVEEFLTDGVVILNYLGLGGGSYRSLQIRKMRRTTHGMDIYPFDLSKNGISVKKV